jgi:hypothetical protein
MTASVIVPLELYWLQMSTMYGMIPGYGWSLRQTVFPVKLLLSELLTETNTRIPQPAIPALLYLWIFYIARVLLA